MSACFNTNGMKSTPYLLWESSRSSDFCKDGGTNGDDMERCSPHKWLWPNHSTTGGRDTNESIAGNEATGRFYLPLQGEGNAW